MPKSANASKPRPSHPSPAISFLASPAERAVRAEIVKRARRMELIGKSADDSLSLDMDIAACHANGTPLRLEALLAADDFNFTHDVCGIMRHMNRLTGQLENCFLPRFSQPAGAR